LTRRRSRWEVELGPVLADYRDATGHERDVVGASRSGRRSEWDAPICDLIKLPAPTAAWIAWPAVPVDTRSIYVPLLREVPGLCPRDRKA